MTGSALRLAGAADTSPFGKFHNYEGTWDGTIFLWDAGYDTNDTVPAHGAKVTNLVRAQAAEITGLPVADLDFTVNNDAAGGSIACERTGKNAIHVASTQAGGQAAASAFNLQASASLKSWLLENTDAGADYAMMMTVWLRITRLYVPSAAPQAYFVFANSVGSSASYFLYNAGVQGDAGEDVFSFGDGQRLTALDAPGVLASASKGWNGTKPSTAAAAICIPVNVGAYGAWSSFNYNKAPSAALYRVQMDLIDLSDIDGADNAAKALAMLSFHNAMLERDFAEGGRFHGDAYTAAATLKP